MTETCRDLKLNLVPVIPNIRKQIEVDGLLVKENPHAVASHRTRILKF